MKRAVIWLVSGGLVLAPAATAMPSPRLHDAIDLLSVELRAREGGSAVAVGIHRGEHGTGPATVRLRTEAVTAEPGSDYEHVDVVVRFSEGVGDEGVLIPLIDDEDPEPPETFKVILSDATGGAVVGKRREATVLVVDDDGPSRISFFPKPFAAFETRSRVDVALVRSGNDSAPASVSFETRDGSALAGSDYRSTSGTATFVNEGPSGAFGRRHAIIGIPLINDTEAEGDEYLYVDLLEPSGAVIEGPASVEVTILDDEVGGSDVEAPYTAFHYPLDTRKYRRDHFKRLLVFNEDNVGGSGVRSVQVAIRKRYRDGRCKWWNGDRFRPRRCGRGSAIWVKKNALFDVVVFPVKRSLERSVRTRVMNYLAYSRGVDLAGNVQGDFRRGQNVMKFNIK